MARATVPSPYTDATRPLDAMGTALAVLLCFSWGFNQVAIKLALQDFPPMIQAALRSGGATLLVWMWVRARNISLRIDDGTLWPGIAAGLLFGIEFIFIFSGLQYTTATRSALFFYTAPFWVVIGSRLFLPSDRLRPLHWLGLCLSFAGVGVAFGWPASSGNPSETIGDILITLGAAAWAATTLLVKASSLNRVPPEKTMLYQLVVSFFVLVLAALAFGETMTALPGPVATGALLYQTVWVVSVTFVIWFMLVVRYSASRLSAFTFLAPLFGVTAGHLVMGDPVTPAFALAVVLVVGGLILVNRPG